MNICKECIVSNKDNSQPDIALLPVCRFQAAFEAQALYWV